MLQARNTFLAFTAAAVLVAGCSIHTRGDKESGDKDVTISSPMGGLKVRTDDVDAKDTGLSLYPGARKKPADNDHDKKQANVNIDTPWFGVKVVAVTFLSDDSPDKVWDFYKKDMDRYGHVLECKKGSPDMDLKKTNKDMLTCEDEEHHKGSVQIRVDDKELKVGTSDRQRIVAVKPNGSGTEFSLVYVQTRGGSKESI